MAQTMTSMAKTSLLVALFLLALTEGTEEKRGMQTKATVVFQSFDWNSLSDRGSLYPSISSLSSSLSQAGLTHVWFPPPSQSADQQGSVFSSFSSFFLFSFWCGMNVSAVDVVVVVG